MTDAPGPPPVADERLGRDPSALKVIPVRHPWRWVTGAAILVVLAMLVNTLLFSHVVRGGTREGRFQWGVVGHYLFAAPITFNSNTLITDFVAGALGLSFNEGAYMAEIVRAGIISVDEGQTEAAQSIGLSKLQTMRRIVLPQAMRIIIPPTGNETISMLKTTSLVSTIAVVDLFQAAQNIASTTYEVVPLLLVASLWYLFFTSILTVGQYYIERYYARGSSRQLPPTPFQRLRMGLRHVRAKPVAALSEAPWVAPHD